jgi:hypothetical protein
VCLSIFIDLYFLKEQLSRYHAKSYDKKRIRVDTMPNSLLMGINGFWSRYHALRPTNSEYLNMIVALCILFTLFEYD